MIKNFKTVLSAFVGVCLITIMFSACSQAGTSRAPGQNTGRQLAITQKQGLNRNSLMNATTQYSQSNMYGTTLSNMTGTTLGNMTGTTLGNMTGTNLTQTAPDRQKADNIKMQLNNMNGVTDANVIVIGNTALVGFKPSGNMGNVNVVKSNITKRVKEIDKTITNVSVSESADIMTRMNTLGTNITGNKPVNTIVDEFNKIVNGLKPTTR